MSANSQKRTLGLGMSAFGAAVSRNREADNDSDAVAEPQE